MSDQPEMMVEDATRLLLSDALEAERSGDTQRADALRFAVCCMFHWEEQEFNYPVHGFRPEFVADLHRRVGLPVPGGIDDGSTDG